MVGEVFYDVIGVIMSYFIHYHIVIDDVVRHTESYSESYISLLVDREVAYEA